MAALYMISALYMASALYMMSTLHFHFIPVLCVIFVVSFLNAFLGCKSIICAYAVITIAMWMLCCHSAVRRMQLVANAKLWEDLLLSKQIPGHCFFRWLSKRELIWPTNSKLRYVVWCQTFLFLVQVNILYWNVFHLVELYFYLITFGVEWPTPSLIAWMFDGGDPQT